MERRTPSPQHLTERQRPASPSGAASARSPSPSGYPSGQSGSTAHTASTSGSRDSHHAAAAEGQTQETPHPQQQQQQQQQHSARTGGGASQAGGTRAPAATSSLFDTTALTSSSSSTPSNEAQRAMAHLLDSVASSSSPTSSFTPPQAAAAVWASPGATGSAREQRRRLSPQQRSAGEAETASARRRRKAAHTVAGGFSELLGESPDWARTPPAATAEKQQQQQPQQSHPQSAAQPSLHRLAAHGHHSPPRRSSPPPPPASVPAATYRPMNMDGEAGTPNSATAEDTSSMFDASSVYSRDDQRSAAAATATAPSFTSVHGSSWASPTEVLQLRAMVQEITARYQREQTRLHEDLARAQAECSAYAEERSRVQQLQKAYTEGLAQCAQARQREAAWTEERALQQLQLEKMMVENQRLQLFIAKRQKLHGAAHGGATLFVPTESQERVLAAVQGVTAAVSAAATANSKGRLGTPSRSPLLHTSGGGVSAAPVLHRASSPLPPPQTMATAAAGSPPTQQQQQHPHGAVGAVRTPSPARRTAAAAAAAFQGSPYTFVSSESTPTPPQLQDQPSRLPLTTGPGDSGSTVEAEHTQLPGGAVGAAQGGAAAAAASPSTNDTASSLSLSATPLHRPAQQQQQQQPSSAHGPLALPGHEHGAAQTAARGHTVEADGGNGDGGAEAQGRLRSSSMLTPSPTASEVASTTSGSRRMGLFATGTSGAATGAAGSAGNAQNRSHAFLSYSGHSDGEDEEGHETNDDPSYARGVNDISSSTSRGSHLSASAALAMGGLMDAQGRLLKQQQQLQLPHQQQQRPTRMDGEMPSSPLITSGSLVDGHLASTAATRDGGREATAAPPARTNTAHSSVVTGGAAATSTTATTRTTTTTTPSLADSTAAARQNKGRDASSSSASTWSLQYLYQLPRTPAEALEEEVRMLKEIHRLTEENAAVTARWEHALALKDLDTDQREHQLLRLAQEHEHARRTAAEWELTVRQLQSELASTSAQLNDARDALAGVLTVSQQQQQQAQARLAEAEAHSRAALAATREETVVKWAVLRRSLHEMVREQQKSARLSGSSISSSTSSSEEEKAAAVVKATEALRAELHRARTAQVALEDQQHALTTESHARITHLENTLVRTVDTLESVKADRHHAVQRIDELEAEVERLREAAETREACMQAMEERLRLATGELTLQQEQLAEAADWQARAVSCEADLETQRACYEKELAIYKSAACNMQDSHHREMEEAVRRYEKLVVRFEALKMQLGAALSDTVNTNTVGATARTGGRRSVHNSAQNSPNAATATEKDGDTAAGSDDAFIVQGTAKLACDSVATLRSSAEATDRVARSLNRAAASVPRPR